MGSGKIEDCSGVARIWRNVAKEAPLRKSQEEAEEEGGRGEGRQG